MPRSTTRSMIQTMTRSAVLCAGFVLFFACSFPALGQSSANANAGAAATRSGAPPRNLEKGQAPLMKAQVLNRSSQETTYAVIFGEGDEVLAGLTQVAEEKHITSARITGIGAVRDATVEWLSPQRKMEPIHIDHQVEVLSLLGDIAQYNGKPAIHVHMVVGFPDGTAHGGHLIEAHVWPTLEVIVTAYPATLLKKKNPKTGMVLIDPNARP